MPKPTEATNTMASEEQRKRKAASDQRMHRNMTQKPNQTKSPFSGGERTMGKTGSLAKRDLLDNVAYY